MGSTTTSRPDSATDMSGIELPDSPVGGPFEDPAANRVYYSVSPVNRESFWAASVVGSFAYDDMQVGASGGVSGGASRLSSRHSKCSSRHSKCSSTEGSRRHSKTSLAAESAVESRQSKSSVGTDVIVPGEFELNLDGAPNNLDAAPTIEANIESLPTAMRNVSVSPAKADRRKLVFKKG